MRYFFNRARRHPSFMAGVFLCLCLCAAALVSFFWLSGATFEVRMDQKLMLPSEQYWLGTDALGRDVALMLLAGSRSSIMVGVVAVGIGLGIGVLLGLWATAAKGWTEEIIMRACDFSFAFPAILLAIMITAVWGPGMINAIIAIGIFNIPVFARITRASAQTIWSRDYVLAAWACGKGKLRITVDHVLPNIMAVLIVQATIQFALAILAEAALSYLGLGTQPPEPSWGRMLSNAQSLLFQTPRLAVFPGLAIALAVLGLNLLGDGLRDLLDPKLSRQR